MRMHTRVELGLMPPRSVTRVTWPAGVTLHVHHGTGFTPGPGATLAEVAAVWRGYQRYHMIVLGWVDIGYPYGGSQAGHWLEGRGFGVRAAHSAPVNHEPALCCVGDFTVTEPTDALRRVLAAVVARVRAGGRRGHRDTMQTSCPGNAAYRSLVQGALPGPSPAAGARTLYLFEELPFPRGLAPRILGPWASKDGRDRTIRRLREQGRTVSALNVGGEVPYGIAEWAPGHYAAMHRFGPWESREARDRVMRRREQNTGRAMRPYRITVRS